MEEFLSTVNVPLGIDSIDFLKAFTISDKNSGGEISSPIYPIIKYINI